MVIQIDSTNSLFGQITCPSNFKAFCEYSPVCKNFCSSKGICVRGFCLCLPGYAEADCSKACPKYSENNACVSSCSDGNFAGPDNVTNIVYSWN